MNLLTSPNFWMTKVRMNDMAENIKIIRTSTYALVDPVNNVWRCGICGHLERFETDGPFENGWNVCPVCLTPVREYREKSK